MGLIQFQVQYWPRSDVFPTSMSFYGRVKLSNLVDNFKGPTRIQLTLFFKWKTMKVKGDTEMQDDHGYLPENSLTKDDVNYEPEQNKQKQLPQYAEENHYETPGDVYHRYAEDTSVHGLKHVSNASYRPLRRYDA